MNQILHLFRKRTGLLLFQIALLTAILQNPGFASAGPSEPSRGLWVTFDVEGEIFRSVVTRPESIDYLFDFAAGEAPNRFPNAVIRPGGQFNPPWSWHLVPSTIEFVEQATEFCDALPSFVEENLDEWLRTVGRYCPFGARIIQIKDCRGKRCIDVTIQTDRS